MRRPARVFVHLAAGVSGVFFLASLMSWGASYGFSYEVGRARVGRGWSVAVSRGALGITWNHGDVPDEPSAARGAKWFGSMRAPFELRASVLLVPLRRVSFVGFVFAHGAQRGATVTTLILPLPFLIILFSPLPLAEVLMIRRRRRRTRRLAAGLCVRCGYDLRASPERCPECGAVPAAVSSL